MKITVNELIAMLQEISAAGDGDLPVEAHDNPAYGSFDLEVAVEPQREGVHGSLPRRVFIGPAN